MTARAKVLRTCTYMHIHNLFPFQFLTKNRTKTSHKTPQLQACSLQFVEPALNVVKLRAHRERLTHVMSACSDLYKLQQAHVALQELVSCGTYTR